MIECLLDSTSVVELPVHHSGKVRDIYEIPGYDDWLLFVTTDRISAYDVIMEECVPNKGRVLTQLSLFWFEMMSNIIPNHVVTADVSEYPNICQPYAKYLMGRSMIVKKVRPLFIECIFRGRWTGSYWHAYKEAPILKTESTFASFKDVCGFKFPTDLQENQEIKPPLFTPSTKADLGSHDENISIADTEKLIGKELLAQINTTGGKIYQRAVDYARARGIVIADTKFEFGLTEQGELIWIDEALTPDSSRFWPLDEVVLGVTPPSFDKQFLRDYLLSIGWDKMSPPPTLPQEVLGGTQRRYEEIFQIITLN